MAFDITKAAGLGTDTIDPSVRGLPFLTIIQKGSPEFDETHVKHAEQKIEGCRPGQIVFAPERVVVPQPLTVIPLAQAVLYTEWKPNKGGFVGNRSVDIVGSKDYRKGTPGTPTEHKEYLGQNELIYTIMFMVLFQHQNEWKKGMISFSATQLKAARQWSRMILGTKYPNQDIKPPIFAAKYQLSTVAESNAKGGWFAWRVAQGTLLSPEADQALLENAFDASRSALRELPKPQAQPQLAAAADDEAF